MNSKTKNHIVSFIIKNSFMVLMFLLLVSPVYFINAAAVDLTSDSDLRGIDCSNVNADNLKNLASFIVCFLNNYIVPFIFALALIAFIWGVMQYYLNPENEEKRSKGKEFIVGGLIALFVMVSVWGLVNILTGTFSSMKNTAPTIPSLNIK